MLVLDAATSHHANNRDEAKLPSACKLEKSCLELKMKLIKIANSPLSLLVY
jgi:hypothetical protein